MAKKTFATTLSLMLIYIHPSTRKAKELRYAKCLITVNFFCALKSLVRMVLCLLANY